MKKLFSIIISTILIFSLVSCEGMAISNKRYESDGGTYFGKPNNGTDWCFVKEITDNWYYYELHWG